MQYHSKKLNRINQPHKPFEQASSIEDINEQLLFYIEENKNLVEELRNSRHNLLNIIHSINGCIELEDWDVLKKLYFDIVENMKPINTNNSSIEKIKNIPLKELISEKSKNSISLGIDFKIMVDQIMLIENSLISEIDLCQAIGIFLDNAIKLASEAINKKVLICFFINNNCINIIIENTFKVKPNMPPIDKGAYILSKYPNILSNSFVQHQVFVQDLQITKQRNR